MSWSTKYPSELSEALVCLASAPFPDGPLSRAHANIPVLQERGIQKGKIGREERRGAMDRVFAGTQILGT